MQHCEKDQFCVFKSLFPFEIFQHFKILAITTELGLSYRKTININGFSKQTKKLNILLIIIKTNFMKKLSNNFIHINVTDPMMFFLHPYISKQNSLT